MTDILKRAFICLTAMVCATSAFADNMITIGRCGEYYSSVGSKGKGVETGAATMVDSETAKSLAGNKLTELLIYISDNSFTDAQVFLTKDLEGTPFYTQSVTMMSGKWNTIYLNTPYEFSDNQEFFIGYKYVNNPSDADGYVYGISHDAGPADSLGDFIYSSDDGWMHLGSLNRGNVCIKGIVRGDNLMTDEISLERIIMPEAVNAGSPFALMGEVKNLGSNTVKKFNVSYSIDGAAPSEPTQVVLNVGIGEKSLFCINNLVIDAVGSHTIKLTVSATNGETDYNPDNNEQEIEVECVNMFRRTVLLEHFSTASCSNCPSFDTAIESEKVKHGDKMIVVAHHAGYGTDSYTIQASRDYLAFYNETTYAPAAMVDRTNLAQYGATGVTGGASPGPVFINNTTLLTNCINIMSGVPSPVNVSIESSLNTDDGTVTITVKADAVEGFNDENTVVNVFLKENGLTGYQTGYGNDYVWYDVIRSTLTKIWGDRAEFTDGHFEGTFTGTINRTWNTENMQAVAFISMYDETSVNNCSVLNSAVTNLTGSTGLDDEIAGSDIRILTVDGGIRVEGRCDTLDAYGIDGTLKATTGTDEISLAPGLYIVKASHDGNITTKKVIIR